MFLCWHCDNPVKVDGSGWLCTRCGRNGRRGFAAKTRKKGRFYNVPYQKGDRMVNWVSVKDGMPTPYQNVLVSGGIAYWDGEVWYTCMEHNHPPIQWVVDYWAPMPKPPNHCPGCTDSKLWEG